ncbi:hypothetical protein EON83_27575 [bacterium]|nr:MAG: hypothetical protein EON83_27575 [bacterium]
MQTEISAVLQETRTLAEQRGWAQVAQLSSSLCSDNGSQILVVAAPAGVDGTPLVEWAKGVSPESETTVISLEGLAHDPTAALKATKIIAVFECGKIIEAEAMEALASTFFGRPSSSYAIVLSGAELVDSPEELETAQRAAWRVLVPEPKPEWAGQDLLQQRCFLWSEADPKEFLRLRVDRDKAALSRWMQSPSTDAGTLERNAALYVLELAEEQVRRQDDTTGLAVVGESALEVHRINNAIESLSSTRRHMVRRLDADASSLERQLTASLQTLEQDMLHGLPAYLHSQAQINKQADVQQVLNTFVSTRFSEWQSTTHSLLSVRGREMRNEVENLFGGIDWDLINRVATRQGKTSTYPQAIVDEVMRNGSSRMPFSTQSGAEAGKESSTTSDFMRKALGAVVIVGVGAVLLGSAGIIAGTVAAVVGVRKMHRNDDERRAEAYGRTVIHDVIGRAITHVRDLSHTAIGPTRDAVNKELRDLEDLLYRGLAQYRNASPQEDGIMGRNPDRELLDGLRLRIVASDQTQSVFNSESNW